MSGYTGPINRNPGPGESAIIIYGYTPSLAHGIVGAVTFLLVALVQLWYLVKKRGHRSFHALLLVGSLMELGGYAARTYAHYRPYLVSAFVAQYFLIVVAPVVFSAAIYLSLTLLVNGFERAEKLLIIKPRTLLICFVTFDAVCTVIQVAGAALIGTSQSARVQGTYSKVTPEQANDILLAGLAIQTFSFVTFLSILSVALYRALRSNFPGSGVVDTKPYKRMRVFLWVILITSDLILLRTLFRLAETAQGFFGTAATSEVLFACLEYLPVILAVIIWSASPPSRFVPAQGKVVERTPRFEDKHQAGGTEQAVQV